MSRCRLFTTCSRTWKRVGVFSWRNDSRNCKRKQKRQVSSVQFILQARLGRVSGTLSKSSLKRANTLERRYLFEQLSELWRRSSASATVVWSGSHTLATLKRIEFFDTSTLVKCSRSIQRVRTSLTSTRVGYPSATFVLIAGINRTRTTRCQSRALDTKSTWSARFHLKVPFGFH